MTCQNTSCVLGGGHNGPCSYTREPVPIGQIISKFSKSVLSAGADALAEGQIWRRWAIAKINRIDMQDASAEELQKALESLMK